MSEPASCNGHWAKCPNAYRTLDKGYPVMRCRFTSKHPDDCQPVLKAPGR